jgi:hypothetical protein
MQDKNLLYKHADTKWVLQESPFSSVSTVSRGHPSLVSLGREIHNTTHRLRWLKRIKTHGRNKKHIYSLKYLCVFWNLCTSGTAWAQPDAHHSGLRSRRYSCRYKAVTVQKALKGLCHEDGWNGKKVNKAFGCLIHFFKYLLSVLYPISFSCKPCGYKSQSLKNQTVSWPLDPDKSKFESPLKNPQKLYL